MLRAATKRIVSLFEPKCGIGPPVTLACRHVRVSPYDFSKKTFYASSANAPLGDPFWPHLGAGIQTIEGKNCLVLDPDFIPYQCELIANEMLHFLGENREAELARHAVDLSAFGATIESYPEENPHVFPGPGDVVPSGVANPNPHTAGFGDSGHLKHLIYSSVWWGVRKVFLGLFDARHAYSVKGSIMYQIESEMSALHLPRLEKEDRDIIYGIVQGVGGISDAGSPPYHPPVHLLRNSPVETLDDERRDESHNWCYYYCLTPGWIRWELEVLRDQSFGDLGDCPLTYHAMLEVVSFLFDGVLRDGFGNVEFREPLLSMLRCDEVVIKRPDGVMFPLRGYWKVDGHIEVELVEKIRRLNDMLRNDEEEMPAI